MITVHVKLIAALEDICGYTTYVFENLETTEWDNKYFMCTRYPNWEHRELQIGEVGYLEYDIIVAGETYYNNRTNTNEVYKTSHLQFVRFIAETKKTDKKYIM